MGGSGAGGLRWHRNGKIKEIKKQQQQQKNPTNKKRQRGLDSCSSGLGFPAAGGPPPSPPLPRHPQAAVGRPRLPLPPRRARLCQPGLWHGGHRTGGSPAPSCRDRPSRTKRERRRLSCNPSAVGCTAGHAPTPLGALRRPPGGQGSGRALRGRGTDGGTPRGPLSPSLTRKRAAGGSLYG